MKWLFIIAALSTLIIMGGVHMGRVNDIRVSPHFRLCEFESPDTNEVKLGPEVIEYLEKTRSLIGNKEIVITSGYRTKEHNAKKRVGGHPRSYHLKGMAIDCYAKWVLFTKLAKAGLKAGFSTAIIYKTHVHFDIREKGLGLRYAK